MNWNAQHPTVWGAHAAGVSEIGGSPIFREEAGGRTPDAFASKATTSPRTPRFVSRDSCLVTRGGTAPPVSHVPCPVSRISRRAACPATAGSSVERRARESSAFTLIELIIVIGIIGLMMGIAVPAFNSATRGNAVTAGASQLVNTLMMARAKAVTSRSHVRMVFADGANTNLVAGGKVSYAVLLLTNQISDVPANWIYLDRWQNLPKGAYFTNLTVNLPTLPTQVPFPTNGGSSVSLSGLEFKSSGSLTSLNDLYILVQEGTLLPNGTIGNIKASNTISNRIFSVTGVAKVLR